MSHSDAFFDPPLPFPIKVVLSATGPVQIYEIPDDQKEAILKQLYIFVPVPSLDDIMEDIHDRLYESKDRLGGLLTGFAVVAILVASVGLFGLISFVIERKRKEIGIRKVLGARVSGIMGLIARDLFVLIGLAGLLALPVSYAFGRRWLQGFYYRTGLGAGVFAVSLAIVLAIAQLCIARITVRAARESPSVRLKSN
jgi:putative ABC transport system permease protein